MSIVRDEVRRELEGGLNLRFLLNLLLGLLLDLSLLRRLSLGLLLLGGLGLGFVLFLYIDVRGVVHVGVHVHVAVALLVALVVVVILVVVILVLHLLARGESGFASGFLGFALGPSLGGFLRADRLALLLGLVLDRLATLAVGDVVVDALALELVRGGHARVDHGLDLVLDTIEAEVGESKERVGVLAGGEVAPRALTQGFHAGLTAFLALEHLPDNLRPRGIRENALPPRRVSALAHDRDLECGSQQAAVEVHELLAAADDDFTNTLCCIEGDGHAQSLAENLEKVGKGSLVSHQRSIRDWSWLGQLSVWVRREFLGLDSLLRGLREELGPERIVVDRVLQLSLPRLLGVLFLLAPGGKLRLPRGGSSGFLLLLHSISLRLFSLALRLTLSLCHLFVPLLLDRSLGLVHLLTLQLGELRLELGHGLGVFSVELFLRKLSFHVKRLLEQLALLLQVPQDLLSLEVIDLGLLEVLEALDVVRDELAGRRAFLGVLCAKLLTPLLNVRVALALNFLLELVHLLLPRHQLVPVALIAGVDREALGEFGGWRAGFLQDLRGGLARPAGPSPGVGLSRRYRLCRLSLSALFVGLLGALFQVLLGDSRGDGLGLGSLERGLVLGDVGRLRGELLGGLLEPVVVALGELRVDLGLDLGLYLGGGGRGATRGFLGGLLGPLRRLRHLLLGGERLPGLARALCSAGPCGFAAWFGGQARLRGLGSLKE
mmetsp:Transcript_3158/g.12913  ORF Transcript_3158/g.12913 Transcript_3158/m.12913 type:complete len:719 (+) Transcript_3158:3034-5190(+)